MILHMKNGIVLCSGGIDSVTTTHFVSNMGYSDITLLFFDYGQKSLSSERKCSKTCAKNIGAKFCEIKLKWLGEISASLINKEGKIKKLMIKDLKNTKKESEKFYVPCRNTIFLIHAIALAESLSIKKKEDYDIFVGFKNEGKESYPDTTKKFVKQMNILSRISCSKPTRILAPLINMDKEDIILLGNKLDVNFKDTFSCYVGKKEHCGVCLACKLRQEGFYWAGIKDPTEYKNKMKDFRTVS